VRTEKSPRLNRRGLRCEPLGHWGGGSGSADLDNRPSAPWFRSGISDRENIECAQLHQSSAWKPRRLLGPPIARIHDGFIRSAHALLSFQVRRMSAQRRPSSGTEHQAGAFLREASSIGVSAEQNMFKQVFRLSALLIASVSIASAAGGGAAGSAGGAAGGGAHGSGGHGGSSFGKPAVENNSFPALRARSPMYRRGGSNTYDWRSVAGGAANKHKSLVSKRTRCRRDRTEQPGPPSPDSAR
jgi:hypothetical protein